MRRAGWLLGVLLLWSASHLAQDARPIGAAHPGARVLLDAHNCYPYGEWWADRIDRALSTGVPLAIEQDLAWYRDSKSNRSLSVLSHTPNPAGSEPTMKEYFFERIRPIVEGAMKKGNRGTWPLITLNLDFKTEEPQHLRVVWALLNEYRDWITTAPRTNDIRIVSPLDVRPVLVLTGESKKQKAVFYDQVINGSRLLVFGATRSEDPQPADNYHRWWNNPWRVIEEDGQNAAREWSIQDEQRLNQLVRAAHERGLWIRFYTLDGEPASAESSHGWFHNYNFGSIEAVRIRWRAAIRAGVDFVAVDQYEEFAHELHSATSKP